MARQAPNVCAGPFGAFYDFYIERPRLMQVVGRALWGIDASVLYASMDPIAEVASGATIADVPCGGGVALRALRPEQEVRYVAADLSPKMVGRAQRRAARRSLRQVEVHQADMVDLPFGDGEVDLFLSFSGLHMIPGAEQAVLEIGRCLKPGGRVVGTTFLSDGSRRARAIFKAGSYRGHALPQIGLDSRPGSRPPAWSTSDSGPSRDSPPSKREGRPATTAEPALRDRPRCRSRR